MTEYGVVVGVCHVPILSYTFEDGGVVHVDKACYASLSSLVYGTVSTVDAGLCMRDPSGSECTEDSCDSGPEHSCPDHGPSV